MTYTVETINEMLADQSISMAFRSILINQLKFLQRGKK